MASCDGRGGCPQGLSCTRQHVLGPGLRPGSFLHTCLLCAVRWGTLVTLLHRCGRRGSGYPVMRPREPVHPALCPQSVRSLQKPRELVSFAVSESETPGPSKNFCPDRWDGSDAPGV